MDFQNFMILLEIQAQPTKKINSASVSPVYHILHTSFL